ncbi:M48 family metallopeptidase [Candidatus Gottesmanbacteria bacterium]|nr:M48 family metallopeptidase [Candidatus Gottesmanbacteria bacterium]
MALFMGFIALVAFVFGKASGYGISYAGIALMISGLLSLGSYYWGDKLVLAISGAHPADRTKDFDFYTVAENLSIAAGIPKPKLYIIEDSAPNAFATGRDPQHAVVCATRGILQKLDRTELEGVIAHELSHIKNFDTRLLAVIAVLVGMVAFLSDWFMRTLWWGGRRRDNDKSAGAIMLIGIIFAILSPLVASLIQLAVSRRREFLADASGALLTRYPEGLARALEKISQDKEVLEVATNATAHLYIINPFKGKNFGAWFAGIFNTHPPIAERVKILRSM